MYEEYVNVILIYSRNMYHAFLEILTRIVSTVLAKRNVLIGIIDREDASLAFHLLAETDSVPDIVCLLF
jgi:hypothetical protein